MNANVSPKNLMRDIRYLSDDVGPRLTGSAAEKMAADYMKKRFLEYVPQCGMENFPVRERCVSKEKLTIRLNGKEQTYPCSLFNGAAVTGGKTVSADLVFFDGHTQYQRKDLSILHGKAVIHYGAHLMQEDFYRRLMEAGPAFLLMVDTRHPGEYPPADGLFPKLVSKYGAVPTVGVAYADAWNWVTNHADRAMLRVDGFYRDSKSQNVIAEIPGADNRCIYLGAHHDTQADSPGADDNAVGCAMLLELARKLSQKKHKHTIRLISFGAEEVLSAGSSAYVQRHWHEIRKNGMFMCNFDTCGTAVGWNYFFVSSSIRGRNCIRRIFRERDIFYQECADPEPFQDMFPFSAAGLPGLALERGNNDCGVFYHHRFDNTPDKISPEITASLTEGAARLVEGLADGIIPECFTPIPSGLQKKIDGLWNNIFC